MAKGKAKNNGSDSIAPPQPRSLRSRKRECPGDEISKTDLVEGIPHQDIEINNTVVDATLTPCIRTPLQESTMTVVQQYPAAIQSCLTAQDSATEGKHAEATIVSLKYATAQVIEAQEETTVSNLNNDSQLKGLTTHIVNNGIQSGKDKEEITVEERNRPPSPTCIEQLQVLLKTTEDCNGSCAPTFEEKPRAKENSPSDFERNQETGPEECSNMFTALGLPAKKKRRMGMRDLTEKERSHFLQAQTRQNGQDGLESAEKQICNNTADLVARDDIVSSPPSLFSPFTPADTEQNDAETRLQPSYCEGNDRAETEGHIAVITSDGTSAVSDPRYSNGKSCEAERGMVPGPEQTDDSTSDPSTEEGLLVKQQQQQELQGGAAEAVVENPREPMKDGSAEDQSPADGFYSNPTQYEETEKWAVPLQVKLVTRTREEKKHLTFDGGDTDQATAGPSSRGTGERGPAKQREAAVSPGGSERKDSCDPDNKPGTLATLKTVHPQTRDTNGPSGPTNLHDVSDSQLNTITLIEEEVMEKEEDLGLPNCHDATDLVCGLIRELSSLNRKVMATHKELENLRRSSKTSRSSVV